FMRAQGGGVQADYDRATGLRDRVQNKVYDTISGPPVWIPGGQTFWYRKTVKGGTQFVLVDPAVPSKEPAFDHARLASSLSEATGRRYTAVTLPFLTFDFVESLREIGFVVGGGGAGVGCALERGRAA